MPTVSSLVPNDVDSWLYPITVCQDIECYLNFLCLLCACPDMSSVLEIVPLAVEKNMQHRLFGYNVLYMYVRSVKVIIYF